MQPIDLIALDAHWPPKMKKHVREVTLSSIIDAAEHRGVAVIDILNAFIQTRLKDNKDKAIIRVQGLLVDIHDVIFGAGVRPKAIRSIGGC